MICGSFLVSSWYLHTSVATSCLLLSWLLKGRGKKGEVYSFIPILICRIDRACESNPPPTIYFFVVAPNSIIVPPHSTLHFTASSTTYPRWLMAFLFSHFPFPFFIFSFLLSFPMEYGFSVPILFLS